MLTLVVLFLGKFNFLSAAVCGINSSHWFMPSNSSKRIPTLRRCFFFFGMIFMGFFLASFTETSLHCCSPGAEAIRFRVTQFKSITDIYSVTNSLWSWVHKQDTPSINRFCLWYFGLCFFFLFTIPADSAHWDRLANETWRWNKSSKAIKQLKHRCLHLIWWIWKILLTLALELDSSWTEIIWCPEYP